MARVRVLSDKNKYYLPKEEFLTVLHFALQYGNWVAELRTVPDTSKAITYDADKVQTPGGYDPNAEVAMRRYELSRKRDLVDGVIRQVAPEIEEFLRLGVCYGFTFWQLKDRGMPCEKDMYYDRRHRFYWELAKKI